LRRGALPHQRLYVCPPDSLTHTRRVLFRDRLRENSNLALQYQRLNCNWYSGMNMTAMPIRAPRPTSSTQSSTQLCAICKR
jgi:hypothetical protein